MGPTRRATVMSGGCLSLFGLPFFIAGLVLSFIYFNGYRKWLIVQNWVETPCWIETAELQVSRGEETTYKATATYRYDYQGITHRSSDVSIYSGSDNIGDFQQEAYRELARYAESLPAKRNQLQVDRVARAPFRCYVNPRDPRQAVIYRGLRWPLQAFMSIFALTFPAIGFGLVVGGLVATQAAKEDKQRQDRFPDQPWKWRKAWSSDKIPDSTRIWQRPIDIYTVWSALTIAPLIVATAMSGAFQRDWYAWLLVILIALWLVPASISLRGIRKRLAIGRAYFQSDEPYVAPGNVLSGMIHFQREWAMPERASVQLVCEKKVTVETSDGRSKSQQRIWSSPEQIVPASNFIRDFPVSQLPVVFAIPLRAQESKEEGDTEYQWKVLLNVPGTVVDGTFEIPVFHTEASRALAVASLEDDDLESLVTLEHLPALLKKDGIVIGFDEERHLSSLVCGHARHIKAILGIVAFNVIWSLVAVFLFVSEAPWIAKWFWAITSFAIWFAIVWQLLHRRSVSFDETGLTIFREVGPWKWCRTISNSAIEEVAFDVHMDSGNTRHHRVRVYGPSLKKQTIVDGITDIRVAKSIAHMISQRTMARLSDGSR